MGELELLHTQDHIFEVTKGVLLADLYLVNVLAVFWLASHCHVDVDGESVLWLCLQVALENELVS